MTKVQKNGFWRRDSICSLFLVLALSFVPLVGHAAKAAGWGTAGVTSNGGKSFSITPGAGDLRIPIKNPGGGWQTAGNYGVQNGATGDTFNLGMNGEVYRYVPGGGYIKYPVGYTNPKGLSVGDLAGAIGGIVGGPVGIACALACPYLSDWLNPSGARLNEKTGALEVACKTSCVEWSVSAEDGKWGRDQASGCSIHQGTLSGYDYETRNFYVSGPGLCYGEYKPRGSTSWDANTWTMTSRAREGDDAFWPTTMNDILPYMSPRPDARIIGELLSKGADIPLPTTGGTVTGPSSIIGPVKSTTNPDGTRTEEKTTYNFSRSGNTVTNTTNNTTTIVYNTDNSIRSTTTTTQTPTDSVTDAPKTAPNETEQEETEKCKAGDKTLGCAEMDTPEGEIPKTTKNITFTPEEGPMGSGQCPADQSMSFMSAPTIGSAKVVDWQSFCGVAIPLRAVILAMASIMAFFIVMPGGRVE
jgi:hypothetical protein